MADEGGSSVNVVAIIAILILVGVAGWFFMGQRSRPLTPAATSTQSTTPPPADNKTDVNVKVDLPDTVNIK
jgi:hypothetical protein